MTTGICPQAVAARPRVDNAVNSDGWKLEDFFMREF
jgi:hypothetical protein